MYKRSTRLSINYRNFVISSHLPMLKHIFKSINYDIKNCDDRTKFSKIDKRFFFFLTNWEKKRKIEYEKLVANRWSGCYIPNTHNVFFRLKSMKQSRWKPGWIPFRNDARGDTGFLLLRCLIESGSMISSLAIERLRKEISCLENTLNRSDLLALNYKYAREYPSIRHASGIFSTIRNKKNNTWSCNRYISSTDLISVSIKFLSLSRVIPSTPLYYTKIHRHLQF